MFRKFRESPYFKVAIAITAAGGILIVFNKWIRETQFAVGFETLHKTLVPIYIGVVLAFLFCPLYNKIVKTVYARMLENSRGKNATVVGAKIIHGPEGNLPVDGEEKRKILATARAYASIACTLLVAGLISMLIYFFVPQVVESSVSLIETLPERLSILSEWLRTNFPRFPQLAMMVDNIANAGTEDIVRWITENVLQGNAVSIAGTISSGVITAVKYVLNFLVGIIIMVYLLNYKERLFAISRKIVEATFSKKRQEALFEFSAIVNETFIGFIVGKIIDSFIIGVLTFVVMSILGMPFAPMISVIVGITNVIPFFGPFIGAIPSFCILMLEDPRVALEFLLMIFIIQQLDGNVIGPKIVGDVIGIGSFWVLISVLIGGGLFGLPGMALGVPVFAVVYRYVNKMTIKGLKRREKGTQTADYFSLEQFGIDKNEINLEKPKEKSKTLFKIGREKLKARKESLAKAEDSESQKFEEEDNPKKEEKSDKEDKPKKEDK